MRDETTKHDWVSLREAAEILGVHPATIRNWADKGSLPARRTPGGHRRFRREDLEAWLEAQQTPPPAEVQILIQNAMGRMRMHISEGEMSNLDWYDGMDTESRMAMGHKGRQMLEALQKFLVDAFDAGESQNDVFELGEDYARFLIEQGLSLEQAMEGFLVFSNFLHEAALSIVEVINARPSADWLLLLREVRNFDNRLLMGLTHVYTQQGKDQAS